jgi:hypothetical protein
MTKLSNQPIMKKRTLHTMLAALLALPLAAPAQLSTIFDLTAVSSAASNARLWIQQSPGGAGTDKSISLDNFLVNRTAQNLTLTGVLDLSGISNKAAVLSELGGGSGGGSGDVTGPSSATNQSLAIAAGTSGKALAFASGVTVSTATSSLTLSGTAAAAVFSGSGAGLSSLPAANLTGTLPAISGANLTSLNASNIASGTLGTARLGSGTANASSYLRGDQTWAAIAGGGGWSPNAVAFVDPVSGNDGTGALGNASLPFASIATAHAAVNANGYGMTLVLPGTHAISSAAQQIQLYSGTGSAAKTIWLSAGATIRDTTATGFTLKQPVTPGQAKVLGGGKIQRVVTGTVAQPVGILEVSNVMQHIDLYLPGGELQMICDAPRTDATKYAALRQSKGYIGFGGHAIDGTNCSAIHFKSGWLDVNTQRITSTGTGCTTIDLAGDGGTSVNPGINNNSHVYIDTLYLISEPHSLALYAHGQHITTIGHLHAQAVLGCMEFSGLSPGGGNPTTIIWELQVGLQTSQYDLQIVDSGRPLLKVDTDGGAGAGGGNVQLHGFVHVTKSNGQPCIDFDGLDYQSAFRVGNASVENNPSPAVVLTSTTTNPFIIGLERAVNVGNPAVAITGACGVRGGRIFGQAQLNDSGGNPTLEYVTVISGAAVGISEITVDNPTSITTGAPHGFFSGTVVAITSTDSDPVIDGEHTITVTSPTTFTIPVEVTTAGSVGTAKPYSLTTTAPGNIDAFAIFSGGTGTSSPNVTLKTGSSWQMGDFQ